MELIYIYFSEKKSRLNSSLFCALGWEKGKGRDKHCSKHSKVFKYQFSSDKNVLRFIQRLGFGKIFDCLCLVRTDKFYRVEYH